MAITIYSLGYERRTIEEFIEELQKVNVSILLDVREYAWSYKQYFRKNKFDAALAESGIKYLHIPAAGNPKKIRKNFIKPETVLKKYQLYLERTHSGMGELKKIILEAKKSKKNICLTCFEKDHQTCHRSILLNQIKKQSPRLSIKHL